MKASVAYATVLFCLLMAALVFLVAPDPDDSSSSFGPNAGAAFNAAPEQ
jgi:hypothetical protein